MISRADKFLEGFKLGSLGVSGKPKVSPPEEVSRQAAPETERIEITHKGTNTLSDGMDGPYLYWKESDGYSYCLSILFVEDQGYFIRLYGGENLTPVESSTRKNYLFPSRSKWTADSRRSTSYDTVYKVRQDCLKSIKKGGIEDLIDSGMFFTFIASPSTAASFEKWLRAKRNKK